MAMSGTWQLHIYIAPKTGKKSRVKTLLLSALLLTSSLSALSLSEVIEKSLQKSPSLESINARITANTHATKAQANQSIFEWIVQIIICHLSSLKKK